MSEDWDTGFSTPMTTSSFDEGRSYGKGRGFRKPPTNSSTIGKSSTIYNEDWGTTSSSSSTVCNSAATNNINDNWETPETNNSNKTNADNWETGPTNSNGNSSATNQNNYNWNSGNNEETSNNSEWTSGGGQTQSFDDADDNNDDRGNRNGRGRRDRNENNNDRRGRSRNRNREDIDDEKTGDDGEEKKPPVTYIPPERSMDDAELFGSGVTAGINFSKYDNIKVEVTGDDVPPPIENFSLGGLRSSLLSNIDKSGYKKPTPVQKYAIPIMMNGRDVMACAQTGSGKTAAYLIPIIHKLLEANDQIRLIDRGCEPQVVVMAPTRELVTQICWEAQKFAKDTVIRSLSVYGGVATMHQVRQLEKGCHIIVATPGRLCDFVERGRIRFSSIRFVVLDEADRMLDQGFLTSMETILQHESMVPSAERQTVMFSATFPSEVQNLAARFMRNYLFLRVGIVGGACENVEQNFYEVEKSAKRRKLQELLNLDGGVLLKKKTLVFVETKKTADFIAAYMSDNKFPSTSIHGDREQREREIALNDFKTGRMPILVATSVAARGLDIPEVAHVINYDLPKSIDEYVHRIGRTGRMGNEGKATSFYEPTVDASLAPDLVRMLMQAKKTVPDFLESSGGGGFDGGVTSDFGGYDIRGNNNTNTGAREPEETW